MVNLEEIKKSKSTKELLEFGIINIDKSSGPTSFKVTEFVSKKLGLRKTSHFGTLDPKVTGVLPVALNRACRLTGYFMGKGKEYVGSMRVHDEVGLEKIREKVKEKFLGKIMQTPPQKSRVKREAREREIYGFDILEKEGQDVLFCVQCQAGTYVRKLIDDLGHELGVGAHMSELRRTKASIFAEESAVRLNDFEKAVEEYKKGNDKKLRNMIFPAEIISQSYPVLNVYPEAKKKLIKGSPIYKKDVIKDEGWKRESLVCGFSGNNFIGIYKIFRGKDIFAKPDFVLQPMSPKKKPLKKPKNNN